MVMAVIVSRTEILPWISKLAFDILHRESNYRDRGFKSQKSKCINTWAKSRISEHALRCSGKVNNLACSEHRILSAGRLPPIYSSCAIWVHGWKRSYLIHHHIFSA